MALRVPQGCLRGVLVGLLAATLLAACGSRSATAPSQQTQPSQQSLAAKASNRPPTVRTPQSRTHASSPSPSSLVPSDLTSILAATPARAEGADVGWPDCPKGMGIAQKRSQGLPMPLPTARYVLVGLTDGPGFVANPCLASQVAWARDRHLLAGAYSVISTPRGDELARYGSPEGVGEAEARFGVASMRAAGLDPPAVWLDVESVPDFDWPDDPAQNAQVVEGAVKGYTKAGYRVGIYSIGSLWHRIVGDLRLGLPEWRPAGGTGQVGALARCEPAWSFGGGDAVFAQWVDGVRDRDVTCPGTDPSLWFQQF